MHGEEFTIFHSARGCWPKGLSDEFAEVRPSDDGLTVPRSFEDMSPPCMSAALENGRVEA